MSPSLRNYLQHINDEVQYLHTVTTGLDKTDFLANDTLKRAVVRSLEIIGEAVKQLPPASRNEHPEIPWRSIARMRDRLIHHYFGIDYDIVWDILMTQLEPLSHAIKHMLAKNEE